MTFKLKTLLIEIYLDGGLTDADLEKRHQLVEKVECENLGEVIDETSSDNMMEVVIEVSGDLKIEPNLIIILNQLGIRNFKIEDITIDEDE